MRMGVTGVCVAVIMVVIRRGMRLAAVRAVVVLMAVVP